MSCSFELINNIFLELLVPAAPSSSRCHDAVLGGVLDLISKLIMVHSVEAEAACLALDSTLPALFLERKLQVMELHVVSFCCLEFIISTSVLQIPLSRLQQLHPPILQVLCLNIPRDMVCYHRACTIMAVSLASIRCGGHHPPSHFLTTTRSDDSFKLLGGAHLFGQLAQSSDNFVCELSSHFLIEILKKKDHEQYLARLAKLVGRAQLDDDDEMLTNRL
jgi:hypothetical protein